MPDNKEADRKRNAAEARKAQRTWVTSDGHPRGGYWYASAVPASEHGTWSTYNNWYCRCWDCREANRLKWQIFTTGQAK